MGENWEKFWSTETILTKIVDFGRHYYFSYIPIAYLGNVKGKTILEAGCGTCETLVRIAKKAKKVIGIDISKSVLSIAKSNFENNEISKRKFELSKGDLRKMKFKNNTFDITFNTGVVEHFDDDRINNKPVEEMIRVTKKGGRIVFLVPSTYSPYYFYYRLTRLPGLQKLYPWEEHRCYTFAMLQNQLREIKSKYNIKYKTRLCFYSLFTYLIADIMKIR